jgi:hypothetical protein
MPAPRTTPAGFPDGLPPVTAERPETAAALRARGATLAEKVAWIAGQVARLPKRAKVAGDGPSYAYTPVEDMAAAVTGLCATLGVTMLPEAVEPLFEGADLRDGKRARWRYLYRITWRITDGREAFPMQTIGEALDWGDKGSNKAQTGARKYLYMMLFHLQTGDDPDAEHSVLPPAERGERPAQQQRRAAARSRAADSGPQRAPDAPRGATPSTGTPAAPSAPQAPAAPALSDDDRRKVRRRRAALARGEQDQTVVAAWLAEHGVSQLRQLLDVQTWLRLCEAASINPGDPLPPDPEAAPAAPVAS